MKFFKNFDFNFFGKKPKVVNENTTNEEYGSNVKKPYKNIIYQNGIVTIIFYDGEILSNLCNEDKLNQVKNLGTKSDIIELLTPDKNEDIKHNDSQILNNLSKYKDEVLELLGDKFLTRSDGFYIKGINLLLPDIILNSFIELKKLGKEDEFAALEMFWYWAALNPIEDSRNDLFQFIKTNDVKLTSNGLLELYRRVNKVATDTTFPEFISEQWLKMKRYKKSPKNYFIGKKDDEFVLVHSDKLGNDIYVTNIGNLDELYNTVKESVDNVYTDNHTKKKEIRIGQIYREDEDKVDLDNTRDCSSGLHVGSQSFMFDGFGDTGVLALVNPMYVRSVPRSATNKMRVSEMMIVAKLDIIDYKQSVLSDEMNDFSELYASQSIEELSVMIDNNKFDKIICQDNVTPISIVDIKTIIHNLQSKIVTF